MASGYIIGREYVDALYSHFQKLKPRLGIFAPKIEDLLLDLRKHVLGEMPKGELQIAELVRSVVGEKGQPPKGSLAALMFEALSNPPRPDPSMARVELPDIIYHLTQREKISSIKERGLTNDKSQSPFNGTVNPTLLPGVYLTTRPENIDTPEIYNTLVAINFRRLDWMKIFWDEDYIDKRNPSPLHEIDISGRFQNSGCCCYLSNIPAEAISYFSVFGANT